MWLDLYVGLWTYSIIVKNNQNNNHRIFHICFDYLRTQFIMNKILWSDHLNKDWILISIVSMEIEPSL